MKFTIIPNLFENKWYFISPVTGNLVYGDASIEFNANRKVKNALKYCDNPYELAPLTYSQDLSINISSKSAKKINNINSILLWIGKKQFLISCIFARFQTSFFDTTIEAFDYIAQIDIHKEEKGKLCLQRTLLAAKISKSFKKDGVLFIGAQLPTGIMHAWIIENDIQPDRQDREWIMYKPLLAITF